MARMARHAMEFCAIESCGKCALPHWVDARRRAIDKIAAPGARRRPANSRMHLLRDLCDTMMIGGSLCALGALAPYPRAICARYFPQDFGIESSQSAAHAMPRPEGDHAGNRCKRERDLGTAPRIPGEHRHLTIDGQEIRVPKAARP